MNLQKIFDATKIFKDLSFVKLNHIPKREIKEISVNTILEERIMFFQTNMKNRNLKIHTEISPKKIFIDNEELIRLIDNLLSNAIKYTPSGGQIEITLSHCFEIVNDGVIKNPGKIIKKFRREHKDEGGFGLGLYIVKKITDFYGFSFSLHSSKEKVFAKICF